MLVHSLWDQEDSYGALAVYAALKPKDAAGNQVKLVLGPWHHGQEIEDGSALGAIRFGSDTAFETGTDRWRALQRWPQACDGGCPTPLRPLYLQPGHKLTFTPPAAGAAGADAGAAAAYSEYVSDPGRPVPFRARPIQPIGYDAGQTWSQWLTDDQREASGRGDVLTFTSEVLTAPVKISGKPAVHLIASTSGTDSDWVVKLIDVYPDQVAAQAELGGYQLAVSMDILRGRYRESFVTPRPIAANRPLPYRFDLPAANHVFLPGHRIMVQVQSSWFPLYDRNPQTYVPNVFLAIPADYRSATQRIYHSQAQASYVGLPIPSE